MEGVQVLADDRISNKRGRDDEKSNTIGMGIGRLEKRPSGIVVNHVIDEPQDYNYDIKGDEMINGVKYEEEKNSPSPSPSPNPNPNHSDGLFNQLITNLVNNSPKSNQQFETHDHDDAFKDKSDDGGGAEAVEKDDGGQVVGDDGGHDDKDGGGNIIDNIVAKLPRTLSEDHTTPPADEASILIHSIIHD